MRAWLLALLLAGSFVPAVAATSSACTPSITFWDSCASTGVPDCSAPGSEDSAGWWFSYQLFATGGQGGGVRTKCSNDGSVVREETQVGTGGNPRALGTGVGTDSDLNLYHRSSDDGETRTATCTVSGSGHYATPANGARDCSTPALP